MHFIHFGHCDSQKNKQKEILSKQPKRSCVFFVCLFSSSSELTFVLQLLRRTWVSIHFLMTWKSIAKSGNFQPGPHNSSLWTLSNRATGLCNAAVLPKDLMEDFYTFGNQWGINGCLKNPQTKWINGKSSGMQELTKCSSITSNCEFEPYKCCLLDNQQEKSIITLKELFAYAC